MWRLAYQALPLGYQLIYITQNNLGDCSNCLHTTQSLKHFALKCPLSKKIWKTVYKFLKYAAGKKTLSGLSPEPIETQNYSFKRNSLLSKLK